MAGFGDLVQKAFYLGVGAASYAAEKAGTTLADLKIQAQKLADEMVARGEMTAEDAKRMVDDMVSRAQVPASSDVGPDVTPGPRRIEILVEDEPADPDSAPSSPATESIASSPSVQPSTQPAVDDLRQQVAKLQEELRRLRKE
jgi:polyhydroxyalkanoate synthesis regulator phasin